MIRGLALTDAPAYVSFRKKAPVSEAIVSLNGPTNRLGLVDLLGRSALHDRRRLTWIQVEHGQIRGLVSVRNRLAADIWDVDHLVSIPNVDQPRTYAELLNHLVAAAYSEGVQRIFLRVQADGEAENASRQVGFCRYTTESIYLLEQELPLVDKQPLRMHQRRPVDHQPLFQLYCAAVPARVRQIEGMTLQEWRSTDAWRLYPVNWHVGLPSGRHDYVAEEESILVAWLQVESRSSVLRLLVRPSLETEMATVLSVSFGQAHKRSRPLVPVRDYQEALKTCLENSGSTLIAQHALLSRSLAVRVLEPKLLPGRRELASAREAGM